MKRVLVILLAFLISLPAEAMAQLVLPAGATGQTVHVRIVDSISAEPVTGLDDSDVASAHYTRAGELREPITLEELGAADATWDEGGFIEVANGLYRLDLPDDAVAPGADVVTIDLVMDDPTHTARPLDIALRDDGAIAVRALARSLGYVDVVEVGAGLTHTTVAAGLGAVTANSGVMVYVHPGVYTGSNLAASGKPLYGAKGAVIKNNSTGETTNPLFADNFSSLRLHGSFTLDQDGRNIHIAQTSVTGATLVVHADSLLGDPSTLFNLFTSGGSKTDIRVRYVEGVGGIVALTGATTYCSIEVKEPTSGFNWIASLNEGATVRLRGRFPTAASPVGMAFPGGTLICDRAIFSQPITVETGFEAILLSGSAPSLAGAGSIRTTDAFHYDATASNATTIVKTPTRALYAKLPTADYLLGTADADGRITADSFDGATAFPLAQADSGDGEVLRVGQLTEAPTVQEAVQEGMDNQGYTEVRAENLDNLDAPVSEIHTSLPTLLVSTTIESSPTEQTVLQLAAGPPDDNALNGALIVVTSASDATQKAVGLVRSYDGGTRTVTLVIDPAIFVMDEDDHVDVIASGVALPLLLQ